MTNLAGKDLILATDLDGTFLGGDEASKKALYGYIEDNRDWLGLVFVTGRDLGFIDDITSADVPRPDLVIGDVGTTVVHGHDFSPVKEVEDWIDALWTGSDSAEEKLINAQKLERQKVFGGRRLSYFYHDVEEANRLREEITDMGYDVLMSDNIYFDVLPRGVQKGPTLKKTMAHFDLPDASILVAGDTLNDRSLFETGLDGVMVGNAEAALVEAVSHLENVYHAEGEGAAGVHDGLLRKIKSHAKGEFAS